MILQDPASPLVGSPTGDDAPAVSRRSFLRRAGLAGGGLLVVAAGGGTYRAYDNGVFETGDGGAFDAWRDWDRGSGPMALVSAAVLAANPHNTQAWVFRVSASRIDLFADRKRSIVAIDPFDREMYTGLGAALENLMVAAPANGYRARLRLLPDASQPIHAASIELSPGPRRRAALHAAIPHRHTDRSAYDGRAIPAGVLAQMASLSGGLPGTRLFWFSSAAARRRIGELMNASARAVTRDREQSVDGFALFRSSWDDIQKHKDGLTLDAQGLSALTTALAKLLPASSRTAGDKFWLDQTRRTHTRTAAAYGIVAVPDPGDNAQRLAGGRLLERVHLWTAANGLSLQHMNQMTERVDRERQLGLPPGFGRAVADLIPDRGWQPLVSFRVGYPAGSDGRRRSPRRPAATVTA